MRFPHSLRALNHRDFRLFFCGQLISMVGTWMQSVAQAWLVLELTGSAFKLGIIGTLQFGPVLLFSFLAGAVADRVQKRRMIMATQSVLMLQAFALALLCWSGHARFWHVALLAAGYGLANTLDMPVRQSFVVEMVDGKADLPNAIAINSAMFNGARMIGPAVAGLVIARWGVATAFALNALSFLAVIFALAAMRSDGPPSLGEKGSIKDDMLAGLRYAQHTPEVLIVLCVIFCVSLFAINHNVMVPLLARVKLQQGAHGFGLMMSALGTGSVIGALIFAWWGRQPPLRLLFATAVFSSALTAALGFVDQFAPAMILLTLVGFFQILFMASSNTMLQAEAPDHMRGRVLSLYTFVFAGVSPIGSFLMGTLAHSFGVSAAYVAGGAAALACVAALAWVWVRRTARIRA